MRTGSAWIDRGVATLLLLVVLGFGGCAQQPQQIAAASHSKEYFPSSVYGAASRRVVENGPVPHGGGQYLVGHPYTVAGQTYYPSERKLVQVGNASWYGDAFHGRLTANGEIYDRNSFSAAHPTMPLPSYARVTNLRTNASMIVRVNDRGPFASNRIMDVSSRVAEALDFQRKGTAKVKVEYVGRASLAGSDDAKLYATLRTNGPAQWHEGDPAMVAEAQAPARVASLAPVVPAVPREDPAPHAQPPEPVTRHADGDDEDRRSIHWQRGPSPKENTMSALVQRETKGRAPFVANHSAATSRSSVASLAEPKPPTRSSAKFAPQHAAAPTPVPPSRHMDVAIASAHHNKAGLRLSRND